VSWNFAGSGAFFTGLSQTGRTLSGMVLPTASAAVPAWAPVANGSVVRLPLDNAGQ
jgi:hypothetical protein